MVFVFDTEAVTNQMLSPMMMVWHKTAEVFHSLSQKYFLFRLQQSVLIHLTKQGYVYICCSIAFF